MKVWFRLGLGMKLVIVSALALALLLAAGRLSHLSGAGLEAGADLLRRMVAAASPRLEGIGEDEIHILIDVNRRTLTVYRGDEFVKRYPVAVGKPETPTPVGEWTIIQKSLGWGGGFGTRWLGLNVPWGIYGIHGTNKPWSISTMASHGCIRMFNRDVEELYPMVKVGTRVRIVGPLPSFEPRQAYRPNMTGKDVVLFQMLLREADFSPGFADGRYGKATAGAVSELETYYGLRPDGVADRDVQVIVGFR